jgi:hypothetical protein
LAENSRLNLVVTDTRTNETYPVYGLQWNETREIVNFQAEEDLSGSVGGGYWREFTKHHRIKIGN